MVRQLKNKLCLKDVRMGMKWAYFFPMGDWGKDEHPSLKWKNKCSIRKAEQFLGSTCFKGWYQQVAEGLVVAQTQEACLRITSSGGLSPVTDPYSPTSPLQPLRTPGLALGLLHLLHCYCVSNLGNHQDLKKTWKRVALRMCSGNPRRNQVQITECFCRKTGSSQQLSVIPKLL